MVVEVDSFQKVYDFARRSEDGGNNFSDLPLNG